MHDLSGFIVDVGIQLTLVFWWPSADEEYVLYILSGLWGMSDGIWETQISGLFSAHIIFTSVDSEVLRPQDHMGL